MPTQFGDYMVTPGVSDSSAPPQTTTQTYKVTIDSGLVLAPTLKSGVLNTAYMQPATANGGLPPYKWVLTYGKLPDGLALDAKTGIVSGTPTALGTFTFTIMVSDAERVAATVTQSYTLAITSEPLVVDNSTLYQCVVNSPCSGNLSVTGGQGPYTWTTVAFNAGNPNGNVYYNFPAGVTLHPDGSFSGTPVQWAKNPPALNYDATVKVTDAETPPVSVSASIAFAIAPDLKLSPFTLPTATVGMPYISPLPVATGGIPPFTWQVTIGNPQILPEYSLDPKTGQVKSTGPGPITTGVFSLTYTVSDSETIPAQASFPVTLTVVQPALGSATTLSSSNINAGSGTNVTLTAKVTSSSSVPSGLVTFLNGNVSLGTATLDRTDTATLVTGFSAAGVYTLTAAYSGSPTVTGSSSAPITVTVVTPSVTAGFNPGTLTVTSGSAGTLVLTLTPVGGYTGTVSLSCGMLPPYVSCSFAPASLTIPAGASTVTDTVTIKTNTALAMLERAPGRAPARGLFAVGLLPFLALPLAAFRRKSSRLRSLLAISMLMIGLGALFGCGAATKGVSAAPGTYSIPITLQLSSVATQSVSVSLIVNR